MARLFNAHGILDGSSRYSEIPFSVERRQGKVLMNIRPKTKRLQQPQRWRKQIPFRLSEMIKT